MECWLGIHALSLPYYISEMKMKYEIEIFGDDIDFYAKFPLSTVTFNGLHNKLFVNCTFKIGDDFFEKMIMKLSDLLQLESLDINVTLQRIHDTN